MPPRIEFPDLMRAQAEVHALKIEKAKWMQAQVALGRTQADVGRDLAITRQAVGQWLDWLAREEARHGA